MPKLYRNLMNSIMIERNENELKCSAVIFSPHPDDETLGCGGTIIKKKQVGSNVTIVFMTDGCRSHPYLISEDTLKYIRKMEALAAVQTLGVEQNNVTFLEFKDRSLWENREVATGKVIEILLHHKPDEIFIPYYRETPSDHWATNKIVVSALQKFKKKITVYEYPIWFWNHWPWVITPLRFHLDTVRVLKNIFFSNLHLFLDFRLSVVIDDILELKRTALNEYKSQMTRFIPDHRWITLNDVANGKFLNCFFQSHEIFRSYSLYGK